MEKGSSGKLKKLVLGLIGVFVLIQFVPYGRDHNNPPVKSEPNWDSPQTRQMAKSACFDCHSHETVWPWYSHIAPMSWLVQRDVEEGREHLNFSDWAHSKHTDDLEEVQEVISEGEMPLPIYKIMHSDARLDDNQKQQLIKGLQSTMIASLPPEKRAKLDITRGETEEAGEHEHEEEGETSH
ncbi:MAG: cytochrome C [Calditrichaeota bacterium]|nr:MAG: cytochrome C [Calditrichota bacterium]